ncbi:conserved hypothetical protein [Chloroherpeton thalassium ATCC 35110]|uniref:ABC-2 type transporter transmembrane domain-containing protein n=1 Tax=Chloroherpeton thalassium (strain ATCC 35110 / GB-78) TaxID=517418 RepID=B3QVS0_CHLT3|nr:ABC transporter permease [Chloroherpeton thalassium]ACF13127.1 conserved hypothetical protein [Chloroherpeton thalassium ATCC 35110]
MHKIFIIIQKEYLERIRSKGFLFSTLLIPLFLASSILIPIVVADGSSASSKVIIAFDDRTGHLQTSFMNSLSTEEDILIFPVKVIGDAGELQLRQDLERRALSGYLRVEKVDGKYSAFYTSQSSVDPRLKKLLKQALKDAILTLTLKSIGLSETQIRQFQEPLELKTFRLTDGESNENSAEAQLLISYLMVFLIYGTTLIYGLQVMNAVIDEKSSRVMEILISSVKPYQLMVGKILGVGLVALTQYFIWILAGLLFLFPGLAQLSQVLHTDFSLHFPPGLGFLFVVFFLMGYLIYASIYAAIGSVVEHSQDAQPLQTPVTLLIITPVLLLSFIMKTPDSIVSIMLSMVPFFSPILMIARMSLGYVPMWQVVGSLVLMSATIISITLAAAKIYRIGVLMYGKKPKLTEMLKWLRYS